MGKKVPFFLHILGYAINNMADDTDFLEGNAPELPTANPVPRPRSPITPVPAPRRIATPASPASPASPSSPLSTTARPRAVITDELDREMRLDPLEDPLVDALADADLPVGGSALKPVPEPEVLDEAPDDDPLRAPDFPKIHAGMAMEEEIPDEDLMPVRRGVMPEEAASRPAQPVPTLEESDEPPPIPYHPATPRAAVESEGSPAQVSRARPGSEDQPPPVPTAKVRPMQVPKSEAQRVETPSLTVDRSSTPASELDMHNDLPDEPEIGEVEAEPEDLKPKKGFKLPAWAVVVVVLLIAGGGFYMLLPLLTKKVEPPKVVSSEIDKIVEAAEETGNDDSSGDSDLESAQQGQGQGQASGQSAAVPAVPADDLGSNLTQGDVQPTPMQVAPQEGMPSLVPVRLDRYTLTTTMIYRPGPQQTGPVQQMGVFDDGGREIYVAKIMYGPNDLQGPSRFLAKVQNLADSSLNSSLKKGAAVLNGPSALNNARVPASIYSITETRADASGMEVREMKTYMIVDADDGCLVFAVQTPDSDTGYGLTKFIEMSSQLE